MVNRNEGRCLWCGGELLFWHKLKDIFHGIYPYEVAYGSCAVCGSLGQMPLLSTQELGRAYPDSYWVERENHSLFKKLALSYQKKIMACDHGLFVRQVLGSLQGKRILELGPGRGDFLKWAQKQGAIVKGWERSPQAVRFLREQGLAAESVVLEDLGNWPEPENPWDLIVGFHLLEHLIAPSAVIAALLPRMAPQGILIFQVPRADSIQARIFGKSWFGLEVPRHVSIPTYAGLNRWKANLNLSTIAEKHFSLRDNASALLLSLVPSLTPNRRETHSLNLIGYFLGVWLFQPLAWLEAKKGKGGTIMIAFEIRKQHG